MTLMVSWPTSTDDDGTGQTGSAVDAAYIAAVKTSIEDQVHSLTNTTTKPKTITDEVIAARNGQASLSAYLAILAGTIGTFTDVVATNGMIVGFSGTPTADQLQVGDTLFFMDGVNQKINFDTNDYYTYSRASNFHQWVIAGSQEALLDAAGLQVTNGLVVGFSATPTNDAAWVGDANFGLDFGSSSQPALLFASGDYIQYDRASNAFNFAIGSANEAILDASGLQITNGLVVGFAGTPSDNQVSVGDTAFYLLLNSTTPTISFDSLDFMTYNRTSNLLEMVIGSGNVVFTMAAAGVVVGQASGGLYVEGFEQTAPAAPAANGYRIFAVDNGAGKTVLKAIFQSGAAQVLATEP